MKVRKTNLLLAVILFILISSINAIEISEKGFKIGVNYANSTGDFIKKTKYKVGFIGGGFISSKISQNFSIQPEFLFSMKGYKIDSKYIDIKTTFNYIEIPILLKYELPFKDLSYIELICGPSLSYNINAKYESNLFEGNSTGDIEDFDAFEIGIITGTNIRKNINQKNAIIFDLRYNFGLTSWDELQDNYFNKVFSIMLGFSFK